MADGFATKVRHCQLSVATAVTETGRAEIQSLPGRVSALFPGQAEGGRAIFSFFIL